MFASKCTRQSPPSRLFLLRAAALSSCNHFHTFSGRGHQSPSFVTKSTTCAPKHHCASGRVSSDRSLGKDVDVEVEVRVEVEVEVASPQQL